MELREKHKLAVTGLFIGAISVLLVVLGNPKNMGFCIACFIRDIAGSMHLHTAPIVEYMRPEIIGIILGSFAISVITGDFRPRSGSSPVLRFIIGFFVMIGALVFLGCPLRMVLRLAGGDLNAFVALLGFIAGIGVGCIFIANGFSLGRAGEATRIEGAAFPAATVFVFVVFIAFPSLFLFSESGPGSMHAPIAASLAAGLAVGILAQRSRLCMAGGIRDDQPVSHDKHLWNFLGMVLVGLGSVMLGGCPLRQLILAGEGSGDSAAAVLGMLFGAAAAHNFSLASSAGTGPGVNGKAAVIIGIVILLAIASLVTVKERRNYERG